MGSNLLDKLKKQNYHLRNFNFKLVLYVVILSVIGILMVNSATKNEVETGLLTTTVKQVIGVIGGIIIMLIVATINYRALLRWTPVLYVVNIAVLAYLLIFADDVMGAKRWIHIPGLGTIQPSEFTKIVMIMTATVFIMKFKDKISRIGTLLLYMVVVLPPAILVLEEPDLSTTLVILFTVILALFVGGISYKWVLGVLGVMIPLAGAFLILIHQPDQTVLNMIFKDHQMERINGYFFPDEFPDQVRQQRNSVMAIGSGMLTGKGLNTSTYESVKNGSFLSEQQCDFIFAVVGEELGFVGSCVVILLIGLIVFECIRMAGKSRDEEGRLLSSAVGGLFAFQSFVNIGVATQIIPNTGLPLPFVSAGLSSLISSFIMIGIVLNVGLQRKKYDF